MYNLPISCCILVIVFVVVEDVLDGNLGSTTVDDSAIAVSLLVTAGALAWYHFAVFREDRADLEIAPGKPPSTIDVPVVETIPRGSLEVKLDALFDTGQEQVIVVRHRDGYEILPHDE